LVSKGYEILSLNPVNHGERLITENSSGDVLVYEGKDALTRLLETNRFKAVVDASQPFFEKISGPVKYFCRNNIIPYIRFVRAEVELPDSPFLFPVYSWEEAAEKAAELGNTIFLTTGSYNLEQFASYPQITGKRLVVRILPDQRVIEKVRALGILPRDIIAMQGPFSREMNKATFRMYGASVIVTKESGRAGGTDSKISAALKLKIPVVVIKRPRMEDEQIISVHTYDEVLERVSEAIRK